MKLEGIKAISTYLLLSESTVMDKILNENLPAERDDKTATYSAESAAVDKWLSGGKKSLAKTVKLKKAKKPGPKKAKKPGEDVKVIPPDGDRKVK